MRSRELTDIEREGLFRIETALRQLYEGGKSMLEVARARPDFLPIVMQTLGEHCDILSKIILAYNDGDAK